MGAIRGLVVSIIAAGLGFVIAYIAALGGSEAVFDGATVPMFWLFAAIAFGINWLAFIPSAIARTEKFYDLTGAITYLSLVGSAVVLAAPLDTRAKVAAVCVAVWAGRLGLFLFRRVMRDGHDRRFAKIKTNPLRFLGAWTIQGLWCLLTAAAALGIISSERQQPTDIFFIVGFAMWVFGFVVEVIADAQKSGFRKDPANRDRFISTGLWSWSQHPNYFGEIVLWVGMAVMALPILQGGLWVTLISPLFVILLLTRVSGIPLLDQHALKKWGEDADYLAYRRKTSKLVLRPPKAD